MSRPEVVLLDMDGVIRHWDPGAAVRAEEAGGLEPGSLEAAAYGVPEYQAGVLGAVSFGEWCSATEAALAGEYGPVAAQRAVCVWHEDRGTVDPAMRALIEALRSEVRVGLLSNAHDVLRADLLAHGLGDAFDRVICSAEIGLAKPDPAIYLAAADALGCAPEACYFADDLIANVEGARTTGMDAQVFVSAVDLAVELAVRGISVDWG